MVLFHKTNHYSGEVHSSEEGEVCWVKLRELPDLRLADGMEKTLQLEPEEVMAAKWAVDKEIQELIERREFVCSAERDIVCIPEIFI